ncbi:hypothetical protein BC829DRAFT_386625 [Chytridium lagenaria]|nr:hypothetical protein BC829DRAFT_386625 [Chytridium lagenaria]
MAGNKEPLLLRGANSNPSDLPDILKNYTKHIIKTQPGDILSSSAEYFGRGEKITTLQLEGFYQKFSNMDRPNVHKKEIEEVCLHLSITLSQFNDTLTLGAWQSEKVPWIRFWALLVASAAGTFQATVEMVGLLLSDNGSLPTVDMNRVQALTRGLQTAGSKITSENLMELLRRPATAPAHAEATEAADVPPAQEEHVEQPHEQEQEVHEDAAPIESYAEDEHEHHEEHVDEVPADEHVEEEQLLRKIRRRSHEGNLELVDRFENQKVALYQPLCTEGCTL